MVSKGGCKPIQQTNLHMLSRRHRDEQASIPHMAEDDNSDEYRSQILCFNVYVMRGGSHPATHTLRNLRKPQIQHPKPVRACAYRNTFEHTGDPELKNSATEAEPAARCVTSPPRAASVAFDNAERPAWRTCATNGPEWRCRRKSWGACCSALCAPIRARCRQTHAPWAVPRMLAWGSHAGDSGKTCYTLHTDIWVVLSVVEKEAASPTNDRSLGAWERQRLTGAQSAWRVEADLSMCLRRIQITTSVSTFYCKQTVTHPRPRLCA